MSSKCFPPSARGTSNARLGTRWATCRPPTWNSSTELEKQRLVVELVTLRWKRLSEQRSSARSSRGRRSVKRRRKRPMKRATRKKARQCLPVLLEKRLLQKTKPMSRPAKARRRTGSIVKTGKPLKRRVLRSLQAAPDLERRRKRRNVLVVRASAPRRSAIAMQRAASRVKATVASAVLVTVAAAVIVEDPVVVTRIPRPRTTRTGATDGDDAIAATNTDGAPARKRMKTTATTSDALDAVKSAATKVMGTRSLKKDLVQLAKPRGRNLLRPWRAWRKEWGSWTSSRTKRWLSLRKRRRRRRLARRTSLTETKARSRRSVVKVRRKAVPVVFQRVARMMKDVRAPAPRRPVRSRTAVRLVSVDNLARSCGRSWVVARSSTAARAQVAY